MKRVLVVALMTAAACSSGGDETPGGITRIDGPAVVDEDQGGADNGITDDPSDG